MRRLSAVGTFDSETGAQRHLSQLTGRKPQAQGLPLSEKGNLSSPFNNFVELKRGERGECGGNKKHGGGGSSSLFDETTTRYREPEEEEKEKEVGAGGGGCSFGACLSHVIIDHASHSRRSRGGRRGRYNT